MLWITTWLWGYKYGDDYAEKLAFSVWKNSRLGRMVLVTDNTERLKIIGLDRFKITESDCHLLGRGCLARLRMFDPEWQTAHRIEPGDRIVCLDLDIVITGNLDPLFDRDDDFTILQGVNTSNPNPYNGSVWMLKAGTHADVWSDFSVEAAEKLPHFAFSDDQDWMRHKIPKAAAWGPKDGVYAFGKIGWPGGDELPSDARIVAFPGHRDPSQFTHLDWVKKHWLPS